MSIMKSGKAASNGKAPSEPRNRIGLYARSYSEVAEHVSMQVRQLREKIEESNRYRSWGDVAQVFRDQGAACELRPRPGIQALKRAVRRKHVTLVLVPRFRDLATLPGELIRLLRFFDRHGCGLRSLDEYLLFEDLRSSGPLPKLTAHSESVMDDLTGA